MFRQQLAEFQEMNVRKFLKIMPKPMRKLMITQMKDILEREENALLKDTNDDKKDESFMEILDKEHIDDKMMEGIPEKIQQHMEQMDGMVEDLIKNSYAPKNLNEARHVRQQQLLDRIKKDIQTDQKKEWYEYVFPGIENDMQEIVASSSPISYDADLLQLSLLTSDTFCYLVYIDQNDQLQCKERGDIRTCPQYNAEKDHEAYAMINKAQTYPTDILWMSDKRTFLRKLGLAHGMRYECGYEQVPELVNDATNFAKMRNMSTTRDGTLVYATMTILFVLLSASIFYNLSMWLGCGFNFNDAYTQCWITSIVGMMGAYSSLWFRYRSLAEITYGGPSTVFRNTLSRMIIGGILAVIAFVAVKSGLLLASVNSQLGALGLAGFIAGFSERFIPSFLGNNMGIDATQKIEK